MNIVHYSHCNLESAEASTAHVMEFAERLQHRGNDVTVVAPRKGVYRRRTACRMRYFGYIDIKGLRQASAALNGFYMLLSLHRTCRFDCIYIRRLTLDPLPAFFSRLTHIPLIVETNGQIEIHEYEVPFHFLWPIAWHPLLRAFERCLFGAAYAVTADGGKRLDVFKSRYPQWEKKFRMIRSGGIDLERFRRVEKKEARCRLGLPQERTNLVWVGTIFAWSGVEIIIDSAKSIAMQRPNVDILIIGEGPERRRLMRMAADCGAGKRVKFPGYIATDDLYLWLSASDCALAPYTRLRLDREDFTSYKIFEYLACGLPIVCSYEKGDSNIRCVRDFNLGATVPPENPEAFSGAVLKVLNDPTYFTDTFVERCRKILAEINATWDELAGQVEQLCIEAVEKGAGS